MCIRDRECSIQRRHQKVVEEAPSVVLTPELREAMGQDAIKVAQSCDYTGAGTVEFLLDSNMNYYFLEMNTRLQVEHPVTELITGVDLVEEQIRIAQGHPISFQQEDLKIHGHALELRLYAENPFENFSPNVGTLSKYQPPQFDFVRLDDGYEQSMEIPIYYDPMIAKLIVTGKNRMEAIQRMIQAIDGFEIEGIVTTLPFGKFVCEHEAFRSGNFDTNFVKKYFTAAALLEGSQEEAEVAANLALHLFLENKKQLKVPNVSGSKWSQNR